MTAIKMDRPFGTESRGVSEVMGYALIFGVILVTATTATTVGFSQIQIQQQQEQISTVQQGFEILNDDIQTIQRHKDPKKQTPLNIQSGSIGYGTQTTVTVGTREDGSFTTDTTTIQTTPIKYQTTDAVVAYDGGLVFNTDRNGGVLTPTQTKTVLNNKEAIIPIAVINPTNSDVAISPSGEIIVESNYVSDTATTEDRTISTNGDPIWMEIESAYADGWETQLQEEGFTDVTQTGDVVRAKISDGENTPTTVTLSPTIIQTEIKS